MSEGTNQAGNPFEGPSSESSETFFNALDGELNVDKEVTPLPKSEQATSQEVIPEENTDNKQGNESQNPTDWKKRYDDSSKNARRQQAELKELQPFKSVINFLKEDSGAVEVLQNYLKGGGELPKTVQEELKLDEDFMFDMDEATKNPESDSGKLFNKMVENKAQSIVTNTLQQERQRATQMQHQQQHLSQRNAFMQKMGYSEEQMQDLENRAKSTPMTYDTMHMVLNQDQVRQNIQKSTQKDIQNQMQNVRNIPTSIGGTNNAGQGMTSEEQMYNTIFGGVQNDDNPF
jgi:hypothetical protein